RVGIVEAGFLAEPGLLGRRPTRSRYAGAAARRADPAGPRSHAAESARGSGADTAPPGDPGRTGLVVSPGEPAEQETASAAGRQAEHEHEPSYSHSHRVEIVGPRRRESQGGGDSWPAMSDARLLGDDAHQRRSRGSARSARAEIRARRRGDVPRVGGSRTPADRDAPRPPRARSARRRRPPEEEGLGTASAIVPTLARAQ